LMGDLDNLTRSQITFGGGCRPDQKGFAGFAHKQGAGVGLTVNGHGLHTHPAGRADDTAGDFAAIGNQYFLEHYDLTQFGVRFSRKAAIPSLPSALALRRAMRRAFSSRMSDPVPRPLMSRIRALASAIASGAPTRKAA